MDREETEQMRKDYEYRITSLQNRVASLQDEVDLNGKVYTTLFHDGNANRS